MSVMVIRPERGCDDIHALIDHVLSDGAGCTEADFPDSCRGRFVILTPASLRAYVEKQVLQSMVRPEFRERLEPGMNVGVHSLASMMSSIIGNQDYGRYIRPSISMMSLRNYVAKCLNDNESLRNQLVTRLRLLTSSPSKLLNCIMMGSVLKRCLLWPLISRMLDFRCLALCCNWWSNG